MVPDPVEQFVVALDVDPRCDPKPDAPTGFFLPAPQNGYGL
jgi:hypothetical protein